MAKNNGASKGYAIGSYVALTRDFAEIQELDGNRIYEVVDAPLKGGRYTYVVAPVTDVGPDRSQEIGAFGADLREVSQGV
jgi:hypothetical protein